MLYTVGYNVSDEFGHETLEATDALAAAQEVKSRHPDASITYSRAANHGEQEAAGQK